MPTVTMDLTHPAPLGSDDFAGLYGAPLPDAAYEGAVGTVASAALETAGALLRKTEASLAAVEGDRDLTPEARGRKQRALVAQAEPQLLAVREKLAGALADLAPRHQELLRAAAPPATDAVEATVQAEIRRAVRELPEAERDRLVLAEDGDPAVTRAILGAPALLSGVSPRQRVYLEERALARLPPHAKWANGQRVLQHAEGAIEYALGRVRRYVERAR